MCRDKQAYRNWQQLKEATNDSNLYYLRDYLGRPFSNCDKIEVDENRNVVLDARAEEIVHAFQIPLPRDDQVLRLHRLFQSMTSLLQFQVLFPPAVKEKDTILNETRVEHTIPLDVSLAYHNKIDFDDDWHLMSRSKILKNFKCVKSQYSIDCDMIQLFELGSVHHEFYLVNIKLGHSSKLMSSIQSSDSKSTTLPEVRLYLTFIYQTGGFTLMYMIMKSFIFPIVLITMCWHCNRITKLDRKSNVLEQTLFALGLACSFLNLPVEWLTLYVDMKWMLLYSDLRQGVFYSVLFTFWIVFCGEHYIDQNDTSKTIKSYWKYIGLVWIGCLALLIFELSQRGMQLSWPFFSIWDSKFGTNLALGMLVLACASGVLYFGLLVYLVCKVFQNFRSQQSHLPAMSQMRRAFYEGVIYRFKFLLIATVFCAALTISYFIFNNINETHWYFNQDNSGFNSNGGFMIGVYGMWNIYVIAVMIFYAPSHKDKCVNAKHYENTDTNESVEFIKMQTKVVHSDTLKSTTESVVTAFANKISSA